MKTTTEMQLVPITKLVPYVNNARTHSPEQINKLRSSLREFGFINPVIIDRDYGVIAGHGRILAAKEEGITEVPCVFADHLTEAQKKAYIIADNRMGFLSKHPTTGKPIPSPFINIGINYMNQAVRLWNEIFQIVKENCSTEYGESTPQDDLMERLLRARKG